MRNHKPALFTIHFPHAVFASLNMNLWQCELQSSVTCIPFCKTAAHPVVLPDVSCSQ